MDRSTSATRSSFRPFAESHQPAFFRASPPDFSGATAILGLALHYGIAFSVVAFYWVASRWIGVLTRYALVLGSTYGILVYLFMNFVVLPLSAIGKPRFTTLGVVLSLIVHAFLIGLPAALFAKWSQPGTRS